jgi:FtsP/CotA-like multicopper oxidase with cupredoxin domain
MVLGAFIAGAAPQASASDRHDSPSDEMRVLVNDNRSAAGQVHHGTLRLQLRAARGVWRPEGERGRPLSVEAFGEIGGPLQVPAPLIRVPQGTVVVGTIRNDLDSPLRIHGLCARDTTTCARIDVVPGETRDLRFTADTPGTYHYWATSTEMPLSFRGADDTQLSGAFIVDPAEGPAERDRILVITEWSGLSLAQLRAIGAEADPGAAFLKLRPDVFFAVNGLSWPHTERFTYDAGDRVRWRVVNLSTQAHPMHLHGFYFDVDYQGDGTTGTSVPSERRLHVVTHLMAPGSTMNLTWRPERAGRWLFHCHTMVHVSPTLHVDGTTRVDVDDHTSHHAAGFGMKGLVLGVEVREPRPTHSGDADDEDGTPMPGSGAAPRRLTLLLQTEPRRFGDAPALGFVLADEDGTPIDGRVPVPGPPLVLERDQPVEITLVNGLTEATSIHWHGMELESYYDGVHGWGGTTRATPMIEPGERFVVRFTPPRAGTFIYHTHLHDNRQLTSGLYGALIVVAPGERFDESLDHVMVISRYGPTLDAPVVINGAAAPAFDWKAGTRHRLRLINITPNDTVSVSLRSSAEALAWRLVSKDGAAVPPALATVRPASQIVGVGETYDFEFDAAAGRQGLWLEVRSPAGLWYAQGRVVVR